MILESSYMAIVKDISEIEPKNITSRILSRREENLNIARVLHFMDNREKTCVVVKKEDAHIEESELSRLLREGKSLNVISREIGSTTHLVQHFIEKYEVGHLYCHDREDKKQEIDKEYLESLINQKCSYKEISNLTGRSVGVIYRRVKELGLTEQYRSYANHKMSVDNYLSIVKVLLLENLTYVELSDALRLKLDSVKKFCNKQDLNKYYFKNRSDISNRKVDWEKVKRMVKNQKETLCRLKN